MINKTIRFAKRLKPDTCQFSILTPYPGSRLFQQLKSSKQLLTKNWDLYDGAHLVFKNPNISMKALQKLLRKAYFNFYFQLSNVMRAIGNFVHNPAGCRELVKHVRHGFSIFRQLNNEQTENNQKREE